MTADTAMTVLRGQEKTSESCIEYLGKASNFCKTIRRLVFEITS